MLPVCITWRTKSDKRMRYVVGRFVEVIGFDARREPIWVPAERGERWVALVTERALTQLANEAATGMDRAYVADHGYIDVDLGIVKLGDE